MKSSKEILASLLRLKELSSEVHNALHDQEHCWEAAEYHKLEKVFDKANRDVWDEIHHKFLKRLYALGGKPEGVTLNAGEAYSRAIQGFNRLHAECQKLYDLVEEDDDYVTEKMLMKVQKEIEEWLTYFEAKLAQARSIDTSDFMTEQM